MSQMSGKSLLSKYWSKFAESDWDSIPSVCRWGIGVTAFDHKDAVQLLKSGPFRETPMPEPSHIRKNVSIAGLDQMHVVPNMKPAILRGIWFPAACFEEVPLN